MYIIFYWNSQINFLQPKTYLKILVSTMCVCKVNSFLQGRSKFSLEMFVFTAFVLLTRECKWNHLNVYLIIRYGNFMSKVEQYGYYKLAHKWRPLNFLLKYFFTGEPSCNVKVFFRICVSLSFFH